MRFNFNPRLFYAPADNGGGAAPSPDDVARAKELAAMLNKTGISIEDMAKNAKVFYEMLGKWEEEASKVENGFESLSKTLGNVVRDLNAGSSATKDINKSFSKLDSLVKTLSYDQKGITELSLKELQSTKNKINIEVDRLKNLKEELQTKYNNNKATDDEIEKLIELNGLFDDQGNLSKNVGNYLQQTIDATDERIKKEKEIQKQLGLTGAAVDGIVGSLGKMGVNSAYFSDLKENLRDAAKSGGSLKVVFTAIGGLTKGIAQAITDPLTVLTFLISQGLKANKQVTDLGKSLGISYKEANKVREEFVAYSRAANEAFITTDRLIKAQAELSEQLGISVKFSEKELVTFSKLTEIVGLSAQEAGKLASNSASAGMEATDYVKQIRLASFAAQQANKVHFSDKQILQDISKLSAGILVKLQNNPKAIAEAVIQAKKFGLTLEQVNKVGDSLLDWESSIENELKAELITGKQLNLEKARYLALTGSQAELSQEIAEQAGSLAEFQNMNVVAQRALAGAFGMTGDEMADMLMKQEAINKYGDKAKELNDQQLKDFQKQNEETGIGLDAYLEKQAEQLSAQENFNNAVQKLQDLLVGIVSGPIGELIGGFAQIVNHALVLKPLVGAIAGLIAGKMVVGIYNFGKGLIAAIPKLITMVGLSSAKAVAEVTAAEAISMGLATVGIIAGIASVVSSMNSATETATADSQKPKDGIAPSSKGPFTITDAYGATAITATGDGLAISPNIRQESINRPSAPSIDMSSVTNTISALSNAVNGLVNKPQQTPQFALSVDGRILGTVVGNQMETGTAQNMSTSYKVA
jgi:hypothetical protein